MTTYNPVPSGLQWDFSGAGRGYGGLDFATATFSGTVDPIVAFGYNFGANGASLLAGENGFGLAFEGDYNDGTGADKEEYYLQYVSANGLTKTRPHLVQMNRTTNKISSHRLKGDNIEFRADDGAAEAGSLMMAVTPNFLTISAPTAGADSFIKINAAAGQNSLVTLGRDAIDNYATFGPLASNHAAIRVYETGGAALRTVLNLYSQPLGGAGQAIAVGESNNAAAGFFRAAFDSHGGLTAKAFSATQSGNLFSVLDSSNVALSWFNKAGYFFTAKNAAPADGDLAANQLALWFDPTNGSSKLMIKAKQADGTVKTASVALA